MALAQLFAPMAVVGAMALVVDRLLGDDDTVQRTVFDSSVDLVPPRAVDEEDFLRWNVERLHRPARTRQPWIEHAARSLEASCSP